MGYGAGRDAADTDDMIFVVTGDAHDAADDAALRLMPSALK